MKENILLIFLSSLVFFLIIEFTLRYVVNFEGEYMKYCGLYDLGDDSNDILYIRFAPNTSKIFESWEYNTHVNINSMGLRDREYGEKESFRIMVLGDSMAFGQGVELNETIAKILESKLNQSSKRVEVINAGLSGYSTVQELEWLNRYGMKLKPNMVILALFSGNDLTNNAEQVDAEMLRKFNLNINRTLIGKQWKINKENNCLYLDDNTTPTEIKIFLMNNFHTYQFLREEVRKTNFYNVLIYFGLVRQDIKILETDQLKAEQSIEIDKLWNLTKFILKDAHDSLKSQNITMVVLYIPMVQQLIFDSEDPELDLTRPNRILREFGKENNITVIDPLPSFMELAKNATLYFKRDMHLNKNGHKIIAEVVYKELISKKLVGG